MDNLLVNWKFKIGIAHRLFRHFYSSNRILLSPRRLIDLFKSDFEFDFSEYIFWFVTLF